MVEEQTLIQVSGMDCSDEVAAVKATLSAIAGVRSVEPNLLSGKVAIIHAAEVPRQALVEAIRKAGLGVEDSAQLEPKRRLGRRLLLVALAGSTLSLGLCFNWLGTFQPTVINGLFLATVLFGGTLILPKAFRAVKSFKLEMNLLMCVAALGAIGIGQYAEGAAVVFLFALAELLESFSLERARRSIQSLLKLTPDTALVKKGGDFVQSAVSEVKVGEIVLVRSGSRIPLDGVVHSGRSSVNQAPITGESVPVEKVPGARVLAGSINEEGSLEIEVTENYQNTKLSQIIRLIEDAQKQKAPTQRFVDTFARYYTPVVLLLAVLVFLGPPLLFGGPWDLWLYRSLVLLVIACPCALVIATPVSIVSGLTAMAKRGVLIKGGAGLEAIGKLQALALDKTGTITEGVPRVLGVHPMNGYPEDELLGLAASIDGHSTHPLARAVVAYAKDRGIKVPPSQGYQAVTGRGAEAVIAGHFYFVGNHRFAHENAICTPELEQKLEGIENQAQSVVVVGHRPHAGCKGEVVGVLALGDAVREGAKEAIQAFHKAGIRSVVMLSGDNQRTVNAIAKQVGIDEAYGDLLPADKVLNIKKLKERFLSVAMIGDGVNDAPAMASASLGIAMGGSGTDTAIETADVTLMQDRLGAIADAVTMGRRTLRVIWFNTGLALATKFVFLVLSVSGYTSLWLAIAADTGTTLIVIANALRLLR